MRQDTIIWMQYGIIYPMFQNLLGNEIIEQKF